MLRKIALLLALAPGLWLSTAFALSLGEINVHSQLNQRFSAVIPLLDVSAEDAAALQVKVADNDAFTKAGLERSAYLSTLNFKVQTTNGASQIVVSSSKIAREPFLSFLLDVNSKGTQLMRAYTVLLDPPDYSEPSVAPATAAPAAAPVEPSAPVAAATPESAPTPIPAQAEAPETVTPAAAAPEAAQASPVSPVATEASEFTPASSTPSSYGPVKAGETLWHIATQLRGNNAVTMNQMMLAIHEANPHAFDDGRLHVQKGAMLKVPTLAQIRAVSPETATERINQIKGAHLARPAKAATAQSTKPAKPVAKPAIAEQQPKQAASNKAAASAAESAASTQSAVAEAAPAAAAQSTEPVATESAQSAAQAAAASAYAEPSKSGSPATTTETESAAAPVPAAADTLPGSVPTQNAEAAPAPAASEPAAQPQPIPPAESAPAKPKVVTLPRASMQGLLYPLIAALVVLLLGLLGLQAWKKRQSAKSRRKIEPIQGLKFGMPQQPDADADAVKIPELPAAATVAGTQKISTAEDTAQLPQFDSTQMIDSAPLDIKGSKNISADTVDFDVTGKFEAETMKVDLDGDDPITEADFHLAYGLYDEAALLLTSAAKKEPARTDIRTKLAETYFRAGKALEFQETAETLKPEVSPAEWQKIAIMGHQLMPDSELFSSGESPDAGSLGHDVDLSFDEPATEPASKPSTPKPAQTSAHTLDFSLEDFDAVTTAAPVKSAPKAEPVAADSPSPSDNTLEFNLDDFDLEKPAAHEAVAPVTAPALSVDEVKIDDDFSLDNMPDDSHAISTGDEAGTKLDLARAYVDMGDNETAVTLLNEVMLQGSDEQKKDAEALIKRMA